MASIRTTMSDIQSQEEEEEQSEIEEKKQETADIDASCLVPQLADQNVTYGDLQTAIQVLEAIGRLGGCSGHTNKKRKKISKGEGLEAYKQSNLRPFRKALASCLELHQRTMFDGKSEEEYYEQKIANRTLKRQKTAERDLHHKYIANTLLRKGRIEKLNAMKQEGYHEEISKLLIPDGHVDVPAHHATTIQALPSQLLLLQAEAQATTTTTTQDPHDPPPVELPCLRSCYVCKVRYRRLHHFYDQLCPECAQLNWEKRHQSVDLTGRVAVVTGARVKIGYQVVLKLLRAGATVIATTRFPNTAVAQYRQRETDFDQFAHRLHVYGLDLRDAAGIEAFTRFLKLQFGNQRNGGGSGIDILINNACQTIRRPAGYYRPFVQAEQDLWKNGDDTHKNILKGCLEFERIRRRVVMDHQEQTMNQNHSIPCLLPDPTAAVNDIGHNHQMSNTSHDDATAITKSSSSEKQDVVITVEEIVTPFETTGLSHATAMSQMVILPEDAGVSEDILPPGVSDINGQQLDLRQTNSWLLKMEEVSTPEVIECMFVNAIAPFVLNSRLKPLMTMPQNDSRPDRYIINVSAMEGKFYRYKTECHPHTNMAKAALNMLTRTSAENLAKQHRIFMNSVDTGWINDENPLEKASKIAQHNRFQTPIDEIDAAARILDPIFTGIKVGDASSEKMYGQFLKDYRESEW